MKYSISESYYDDSDTIEQICLVDDCNLRHGLWLSFHAHGGLRGASFASESLAHGEVIYVNSEFNVESNALVTKSDATTRLACSVSLWDVAVDSTHEQLIQIAKEHNLPLLSELPKTEEEVTLWNLKYPDLPMNSRILDLLWQAVGLSGKVNDNIMKFFELN